MTTKTDAKSFMALKNRMDQFTGAAVYYGMDAPQSSPAATPWLQVDDVRLDYDTRYTGNSDPDEYRGILNIAVMAPASWTYAQGLGLAANVADHFPKGAQYTYDGVTVHILAHPRVIGSPYQDNGRLRYPVQVKWRSCA